MATTDSASTPASTPTDKARAACERMVKVLSDRTGIAWSFGYLGNVSGLPGTPLYRDDRSWYAFAAHPGRVGTHKDSIGGVATADLPTLVTMLQGALALTTVLSTPR